MIQIDDSGSGSFLGGTCIGVYRPETNEYYFDIIPVRLYNKENFKKKLYLNEVVNIVAKSFLMLDVQKEEIVEVCRGYMFEELKQWLNDNNFNWYCTQITGHFQQIVEKNYELYTLRLGLTKQYIRYTKYPFHFHKLLRWVFADYENRIGLCKVGWKSWEKLSEIHPQTSEEVITIPHLFCLKCGMPIDLGSTAKVIRYVSNKESYTILHRDC